MPSLYYLVSTLPLLTPGSNVPFSSDEFTEQCKTSVSEQQFHELANLGLIPTGNESSVSTKFIRQWEDWETCLRNSILRFRASKLDKDSSAFVKHERDYYSEIDKGVQEAYAADNPLKRERALDNLRWTALNYFEAKHQFDFGKLCIYKLRLMLCEKWLKRTEEKGKENLEKALSSLYTTTEQVN